MEANYGKTCITGSKRAGKPVTLLPVTKRVSNYVAALPLLHSVTEERS